MKTRLHNNAKRRRAPQIMAALLSICAILAAPLALVARGEACGSSCTMMCCMMMHHHAATPSGHMHCQGSETQGSHCAMNGSCNCNHTLDYGFAMPLPLSTFITTFRLVAPADFRGSILIASYDSLSGFTAQPFEPPRW